MLKNNGNYYIYRHIRLDINQPFYIGVGTKRDKNFNLHTSEYGRAFTKSSRSSYWGNIVAKTDYEVEILLESDDYDFIKQKEIEFIALYKRTDCCQGVLVNLTDGGEGTLGREPWNKGFNMWEDKQHPNKGKKLSKETCDKKSESMKKSDKSLKGKKLPEWWCEKISEAVKGENNSMYAKTGELHPNSKKVINIETKEIYNSATEASKDYNLDVKALSLKLLWKVGNETNLVYLQEFEESGEDLCRQMLEKSLIRKPKIKGVIDKVDGTFYKTIGELANKLNIKAPTLRHQILKNKTTYEFIYEL